MLVRALIASLSVMRTQTECVYFFHENKYRLVNEQESLRINGIIKRFVALEKTEKRQCFHAIPKLPLNMRKHINFTWNGRHLFCQLNFHDDANE